MNKKIEKLFKKFDIILKNYELDKACGQLSVDSVCHLFPTEIIDLKKYIQDLQQQLEEKDKVIDEATEYKKKHFKEMVADEEAQELLEILERGKNGK